MRVKLNSKRKLNVKKN